MIKTCPKCVYFIGKLANNERWEWTHCKAGVQNITKNCAEKCRYYAETIKDALEFKLQEIIKNRGWANKCPTCGQNTKLTVKLE